MKRNLLKKNLLLSLCLLTALAGAVSAQGFNKTFRTTGSGELELVNKMGSVAVNVAEGNMLSITAKQAINDSAVKAEQSSSGKIEVEVSGNQTIDFVVNVPAGISLKLTCFKGEITVRNVGGNVRAETTQGDILITGVRSSRVEAKSQSGNVSFSGDILPSGNYTLKSFSGRVAAVIPSSADFALKASSYRGGMDVSGVGMSFTTQTDKLVEGTSGAGKATVSLWTQEGSISLRRR
jgi:DUF4097 and DUF4098 domain-containing protein YvlB